MRLSLQLLVSSLIKHFFRKTKWKMPYWIWPKLWCPADVSGCLETITVPLTKVCRPYFGRHWLQLLQRGIHKQIHSNTLLDGPTNSVKLQVLPLQHMPTVLLSDGEGTGLEELTLHGILPYAHKCCWSHDAKRPLGRPFTMVSQYTQRTNIWLFSLRTHVSR